MEFKFDLDEFDFTSLADLEENVTICINGASKSGKNYWANEAIFWLNKSKKAGRFKYAFLFSATAHIQDSFPQVPQENRFTDLNNLQKIIDIRMETQNKSENILLILDDFATMKENGKMIKNSDALTGLTYFRHLGISCLMLTHRDTQLSPLQRNSCAIVVNFLPKTKQDQKSIKERYLSIGSTKDEIDSIYKQVFSEKYRALVCEQYKNAITLKDYCSVSTAPSKLRKYKLRLIPNEEKKKKEEKIKSKYRLYAEI
tara:strand:+ start:1595 stop:2365 length:771 start_codon:yes stop_codon:yes gene_type:complete